MLSLANCLVRNKNNNKKNILVSSILRQALSSNVSGLTVNHIKVKYKITAANVAK